MLKVGSHFINKDFSDAQQLKMVEAFQLWGLLQRESEFTALLNMISHGGAYKSKILDIPVGDKEVEISSLNADTAIGAVGTTITLVIPVASDPSFNVNDTMKVIDSGTANSVATLRTTGLGVVAGTTVTYSNVQVLSNTNPGHTYAAASTQIQVMGNAYTYDGTAPLPRDIIPSKIKNVMQDFREAFGKGSREMADTLLFNQSLDHLSQISMNRFMRKLASNVLLSEDYTLPTSEDYGYMKGMLGFIKDGGQKLVTPAGAFDYDIFLDFFSRFDSGSKTKVMVASPATINLFLSLFRGIVTITNTSYTVPGTPIVWSGLSFEFAYGTVLMIPDRTLSGKSVYIDDGTNDATSDKYAMFVDLDNTRSVFLDVPGEGAKTVGIKDVSLSNNDTRKLREIETIQTLITVPETNGIILFS